MGAQVASYDNVALYGSVWSQQVTVCQCNHMSQVPALKSVMKK